MLEEEYNLDYFKSKGLERKICTECGSAFWTRDPEKTICGDAPCVTYSFIGEPVFREHSINEMREAFLSFFEHNSEYPHTRLNRYPVAARWRDDIYLTIASIADFQPYVTSGLVPPPANPLTISQPCIRLNDLDSVGRSGRHLTLFEMMAHHAFNNEKEQIYFKDETVRLCDEFLLSLGAKPEAVTYKEYPWVGGGNAGPSLEVLIGGLEVATLVFMYLTKEKSESSPVDINGVPYYPMNNRIVDTGYGLERLVWASKGSPTIYDAVFPDMVSRLMKSAGLDDILQDKNYAKILGQSAKFAGVMDISGSNLSELRNKVSKSIGVPAEYLEKMIAPVEKIYTISDHTRCLAYMLGDCIVPSNAREGYLARLVLRRTLRMMHDLNLEDELYDLIEMQMAEVGMSTFEQNNTVIQEIVENEVKKYSATLQRGTRTVRRIAQKYRKAGNPIPLNEMITLYDSHGIPPDIIKEVATEEGAEVELPDNFYSVIADMHSESEKEEDESPLLKFSERLGSLPATKKLYYEKPIDFEFEAMVLDSFDGYIVLDQTLFYPEGGGQPSDVGKLIGSENVLEVTDTTKVGDVILHKCKGEKLPRGKSIKGIINKDKRLSLMCHHSATHIVLHASKKVLGPHIHQAGAQKGEKSARLDIRHFRHITPEELKKIEIEANRMVMEDTPVNTCTMERTDAEQKYGFDLYQGGVPPGREIRIVKVAGDIEACAGTHCRATGEIGAIKIIRLEHIQDGIERIEYSAGLAAINYMQSVEKLLNNSADVLSIQPEKLPASVKRFFNEWKERGKEIERLTARFAELEKQNLKPEEVNGIGLVAKRIDASNKELSTLAREVASEGGVALLISTDKKVSVVISSGTEKIDASAIIGEICEVAGGKGGGKTDFAQGAGANISKADETLERGKEIIKGLLNG